eukprot:758288-Hanusia_phi.AAC.2
MTVLPTPEFPPMSTWNPASMSARRRNLIRVESMVGTIRLKNGSSFLYVKDGTDLSQCTQAPGGGGREGEPKAAQELAGEAVELGEGGVVEVASYGPDESEDEEVVEHAREVVPRHPVTLPQQRVEEVEHAAHKVDVSRDDILLALPPHEHQRRVHGLVEQILHLLLALGEPLGEDERGPGGDQRLPAEIDGLQVDHAAATDGSGGGDGQVVDLELHGHGGRKFDALAVVKAQRLVVVEDSVHGFNPDGVDWAIAVDPLLGGVALGHRIARLPHDGGDDPVSPLEGQEVELAVELSHGDGLGVQRVPVDSLEALHPVLPHLGEGAGEGGGDRRLADGRDADKHDAMADDHGLLLRHQLLLDVRLDRPVVDCGDLDAGEEVAEDGFEEGDVVGEELGDIGVAEGADERHVLDHVRVGSLQLPRHHQHRLHRAHPKVVVVLRGDLLGGEAVHGRLLAGQREGVAKALGEEHDLGDEGIVGDHHRHGPEERFEVVRQLGPPGVPGIHRDEAAVVPVEPDELPEELEALGVGLERVADGHDLLGDHRQHLDVDPVELVEAGPRSCLRQARKELLHHLVVQPVRAVEHNHRHRQRLPQVLNRLRLARPCWARRSSSEQEVERACQSHEALVGEGGDDEAGDDPEVLPAVEEHGVGLPHHHPVLLADALLVPVVPQLADPGKVRDGGHLVGDEPLGDVPGVYVDDDEVGHDRTLDVGKVMADDADHLVDLLDRVLLEVDQAARVAPVCDGVDGNGGQAGPGLLVDGGDGGGGELEEPGLSDFVAVRGPRLDDRTSRIRRSWEPWPRAG